MVLTAQHLHLKGKGARLTAKAIILTAQPLHLKGKEQ